MRTIEQIRTEVYRIEKKLKRAKVRENFGQKDLRGLDDYIGYLPDYSYQEREIIFAHVKRLQDYCYNKEI